MAVCTSGMFQHGKFGRKVCPRLAACPNLLLHNLRAPPPAIRIVFVQYCTKFSNSTAVLNFKFSIDTIVPVLVLN